MKKKNILIIVSDQLSWKALPSYGDQYAITPHIDSIAENGVSFERCYTPCPLCQPARASFWTSKYPHEIDVMSNGRQFPFSQVGQDIPTLGETFKNAGYETMHFGKRHDAGALRGFECVEEGQIEQASDSGVFVNFDTYKDYDTTEKIKEYLDKRENEKPLMMVADFVNPHTICGYIGDNKGVHENKPVHGLLKELPDLPENFEFPDIINRPLPVQYICCSHNRQAQTAGWTKDNFRHYLLAYYEYLNMVDIEIGKVLDKVKDKLDMDNTLIVFMADHGDSMVARARVTKQVDFYEEVSRVPFIFSGKGVKKQEEHIQGLASLLDLFPTLCDYADIEAPKGLRGISLLENIQTGKKIERDYVESQWHTEWGYTVSPGRMICDGKFKYTKYIEDGKEELYDLKNDPYEKINQVENKAYIKELTKMRQYLDQQLEQTKDPFYSMEYYAASRWRSHEIGYDKHQGPAAPMEPFSKV